MLAQSGPLNRPLRTLAQAQRDYHRPILTQMVEDLERERRAAWRAHDDDTEEFKRRQIAALRWALGEVA